MAAFWDLSLENSKDALLLADSDSIFYLATHILRGIVGLGSKEGVDG
jgi:hypothetical protein